MKLASSFDRNEPVFVAPKDQRGSEDIGEMIFHGGARRGETKGGRFPRAFHVIEIPQSVEAGIGHHRTLRYGLASYPGEDPSEHDSELSA
jgi:hypothetical protein